eukprot:GHVO01018452.1.p2 GENE.GHVO01018452.1~~GHVO01018452.1.p2  ORF type:complete len:102 (-),score=12.78 GHVO01018452.1:300-605(-)
MMRQQYLSISKCGSVIIMEIAHRELQLPQEPNLGASIYGISKGRELFARFACRANITNALALYNGKANPCWQVDVAIRLLPFAMSGRRTITLFNGSLTNRK